jgi:hypothetical protein
MTKNVPLTAKLHFAPRLDCDLRICQPRHKKLITKFEQRKKQKNFLLATKEIERNTKFIKFLKIMKVAKPQTLLKIDSLNRR